jgi:hypothetical protein
VDENRVTGAGHTVWLEVKPAVAVMEFIVGGEEAVRTAGEVTVEYLEESDE